MAHTKRTVAYNGNVSGQANTFSYSGYFDVFKGTEVVVLLDNVELTYTASTINESASPREYTVDSVAKTIHIGGADLSSGTVIIRPNTDLGQIDNVAPKAKAEFTPGASITSADLNNNQTQLLRKCLEYDENLLSTTGGTMTGDLGIGEDQTIIFEGATDDGYETTLTVADPTADRTITLPNVTGTVVTTGDTGTVAHAMLAADAVDGDNIGDDSINSEHYVDASIDHAHLANDAVDGDNIADNSIDSEHYVDLSIDTAHIANDAVTAAKIADGTIEAGNIGSNAITHGKMADSSVGSSEIISNSVDSQHYVDGSIDHEHLANDCIDGDNIQDDVINSEHYADASIDHAHLSDDCIDGDNIQDDAVGAEHIASNAVVNDSIAAGAAIAHSKLANVTDGQILVGNGSNVPTAVAVSGDVTIANTGAVTIANDAVEIGMIGCEQTTISDSDSHIPTSGAVVDYVAAQIAPIGGLEVIADDESFPNTIAPAGVVISITDAAGLSVNSSGVSTNADTLDNSTVTINGFPSELRGGVGGNADPYVFASGAGLMVKSTGSSQTYDYHQALIRESDFVRLSDDIDDFNQRYRVAASAAGVRTGVCGADGTGSGSYPCDGDMCWFTGASKMYVFDAPAASTSNSDLDAAWKEVSSVGDYKILTVKDNGQAVGGTGPTFNSSNTQYDLFDGSADASITNAQQLIVVLNGVIQKPNSGSYDTNEEGFYLDGSDGIRFCDGPPSGSSLFVTQIGAATTISTPGTGSISNANMFAAGVINAAAIGTGAVEHAKLDADCVDGDNLADNACDSEHYTDGSIDHVHLAADCIDGDNIQDDVINSEHYAAASIDHEHLANDCVDGDNIADNSIGLEHLASGTDGNLITYDTSGNPAHVSTGTSGHVLTSNGAGAAPTFQAASGGRIYRNIVVNGAMNVAQRATSSTSSGYKTIDRIKVDTGNLGQTCTVSQRALTSSDTGPFAKGFRNCLKIALASNDSAAANKYIQWGYRVESRDIATSGWDYGNASSNLNVSFWIKVSAAQTFYLMIEGNNTGTNRYYVKPFTPSGTSWEKISLSIPGDASTTGFNNDNATGATFWIMPYYGTDYTATGTINSWHNGNASTSMPDMASTWLTTGTPVFELTGYQIEAGDEATEFEFKSLTQDLLECYRYCQGSKGDSSDFMFGPGYEDQNGSFYMPLMFRPPMRASPSMVLHNGGWKQNTPGYDSSEYTNAMSVYDPQPGPIFTAVLCWKDTDISSSVNRAGTCWMRASQSDTRICMEAEL